jgi:hypothetical protein
VTVGPARLPAHLPYPARSALLTNSAARHYAGEVVPGSRALPTNSAAGHYAPEQGTPVRNVGATQDDAHRRQVASGG